MHQGFKDMEIGRIPKEWEVVRLGDVLSLKNGERSLIDDNGIFPIYGANGIMGYTSKFLMDSDFTVIIGRVGASGKVHFGRGKIWISDNAIYSEEYDKSKIYMPFIYHLLKFKKLSQFASKSTHPIITQSFLNSFLVSLPLLPEQKKIADILSTVDQAIEKVDKAIAKTERLKKGLMHELLTKGIGHKEFIDTEIGKIPKGWEVVRMEDISLDLIGGGTPSTSNSSYWNGEVAWMTSAHINEREIDTGQRYITKEGLQNSSTSVVPEGNLLVATRVGIGKAAINKIDIAISQDLTGIIINKNRAIPDFVYWYLINNKNRLRSLAQGSTIKGILRESLGNLRLPLPPLPEQQKIAEILSTVDKRLQLLKEKKRGFKKVKRGLMSDLLTGKKRVKI
jgi:type I restriction enzyme S subunit